MNLDCGTSKVSALSILIGILTPPPLHCSAVVYKKSPQIPHSC